MGDGSQPLISQYYGEKDQSSVRATRKLAYLTAAVITVVCMVGVYLARAKIGILFGASAETNAGVIQYLPFFLATLLFLAFVRITTSYFYATEKNALSYLLVYAEPLDKKGSVIGYTWRKQILSHVYSFEILEYDYETGVTVGVNRLH